MRQWKARALAVGLLALGVLAGLGLREAHRATPVAHAAQTWDVLVGPVVMEELLASQGFGPEALTINVGDTVRFTFAGFHTVTFPGGRPLPPLVSPGTEAGSLVLALQLMTSSLPPGQSSATYDGTQFLNYVPEEGEGEPGAAPETFSVTFSRAGTFGYFCALHPGMRGSVSVAPESAALPETPTQASARGQAEIQMAIAVLREQVQQAARMQPATTEAPGRSTTHTAIAGLGSGFGASLLGFLPDRLTVRRGDLVVWTLADPFEIHTVTFTGGAPAPEFVQPQFGPGGPGAGPPTLVIPANVASPVGGDTYRGTGYLNSGIIGPGQSFALRFDAPAGSYEYLCIIHPFMKGTVTVIEP